jgi:hypothetical protein
VEFFVENGILTFDPANKTPRVYSDKYHDVGGRMLGEDFGDISEEHLRAAALPLSVV